MSIRAPFRLLLCAPADTIEGGIVAVVQGLIVGLQAEPEIEVRRLCYGKFRRHSGMISRLLRELVQIPVFVSVVVRYRPHAIQIESSFDRKTLVRDSIFLWLARVLRRRVILHAHGGVFHEIPSWSFLWGTWARWFLRSLDAVVVTSKEEHRDLDAIIGPAGTFVMIPNPLIVPSGSSVERGTDGNTIVVFAGRFIASKGVLDALEAMRHVRTPSARLIVFGDGELREAAERLAAEPGVAGRVELRGNVELPELLAFYRMADIFVFPSYHHEGFPMAFFFAAACGMGIVSTRVRPIPDYCKEPDNCLWVEARNPHALAEAIDTIAANPTLRRSQGRNNMELVAQFEPVTIARRFLELYQNLPARRGA
ncbi:MAG: glycosyltransferase family 4 protein [Gemmatimonadaceae bacterium]